MAWKKLYHAKTKSISSQTIMVREYEPTEPTDENMEIEKRYCKRFGCGERLTLVETLCGDFCEKHMNMKKGMFFNGLL